MALTALDLCLDGTNLLMAGMGSQGTHVVDAETDGVGFTFKAPKSGDIEKVVVTSITTAGTVPTMRVGMEDVSASNGAPGGSYLGATNAAYGDSAGWGDDTQLTITLGENAGVTAGDDIAVTARWESGTIDGGNNVTFLLRIGAGIGTLMGQPQAWTLTAGTWAVAQDIPCFDVIYTDGTRLRMVAPYQERVNEQWSTDEAATLFRGNKYVPTIGCELGGALLTHRTSDTAADFRVGIWQDGVSDPLVDYEVDASAIPQGDSNHVLWCPMPVELVAGETYYALKEPTTATDNTLWNRLEFASSALRAGWCGPLSAVTADASGGNPSTYSETTTAVYQAIWPVIRKINTGVIVPRVRRY